MQQPLQARWVAAVPSNEGQQADLLLVEPNGDEHAVRCLVKPDRKIDIGGQPQDIEYLCARYGTSTVFMTAGRMVDPSLGYF